MLLSVGLMTIDVLQVVAAVPAANQKTVARSSGIDVGGPAANAASTARLLGAPARLVTGVGADPVADLARRLVAGFDLDLVDALPDRAAWTLPLSTVLVTEATGERAVVSRNAADAPPLRWDDRWLVGVTAVLVDGHHPHAAIAAAAAAKARGVPVVLDGGSWKDSSPELLPMVDIAILSADFRPPDLPESARSEDVLELVRGRGPGAVAMSRGADPILLLDGRGLSEVEVRRAVRVRDTVGAGDVLHGAFAAELALAGAQGRYAAGGPAFEVASALRAAASVATLSCEYPGARGWAAASARRPGADPVAQFLGEFLDLQQSGGRRPVDHDGVERGGDGHAM